MLLEFHAYSATQLVAGFVASRIHVFMSGHTFKANVCKVLYPVVLSDVPPYITTQIVAVIVVACTYPFMLGHLQCRVCARLKFGAG